MDTQLRVSGVCGVGAARLPLLRAASLRYRKAMQEAIGRAEAGKVVLGGDESACAQVDAEVEDMRTVLALWHLAEIPALHVGAETLLQGDAAAAAAAASAAGEQQQPGHAAELRGSPPLALLAWLRDNFWGPTSEATVLQVVNALRNPSAATGGGRAELDAWDVAVKLALEGEPNDAGRLLHLLAATTGCRETEQLAEVLKGYPLLADALEDPRAHARALGGAWAHWRAGVQAFRRATLASAAGSHFLRRANGTPGVLLDVLCGDSWEARGGCCAAAGQAAGLRVLRLHEHSCVPGGAAAALYATWMYDCGARVLYGERCPLEYTAPALSGVLRECIARAGGDVHSEEGLESAFVRILGGSSTLTLTMFSLYRQPWAAAHFADLLWHSASGGAAPAAPALWPPWDAPLRPHLLLSHALALPTYGALLGRAALTYVLATFPQAVLRVCGVRPQDYAADLGLARVGGGGEADFSALAEGLAGAGAHALSPAARTAKLALLSGASAAAGGVLEHALLGLPLGDERAALSALRLCHSLGVPSAANRLGSQWVQRCLASSAAGGGGGGRQGGGGGGGALGTALAWATGLRAGWPLHAHSLRAVAAALTQHLDAAVREGMKGALVQLTLGPLVLPWFPSSAQRLPPGTAQEALARLEDSAGLATVDDALAAAGHDAEDDRVVEGRVVSNSQALVGACAAEPLLLHALHLRSLIRHMRAGLAKEAIKDLTDLAARPVFAPALSLCSSAARVLRFAAVMGLLAQPQQAQALLKLVLEEQLRCAEALFDATLGERVAASSAPSAGLEALVDQPLGIHGLEQLRQMLV